MTRAACPVGLLACLTGVTAPAAAQDSAAVKIAHITYLTSATAYLDAGRLDGLREGTRVEVVRGGAAMGVLKVAFLASHQSSCDIVTTSVALAVGDSARFLPVAIPRDSGIAPRPSAASPLVRRGLRVPGLRGRIGAEYLGVGQLGGTAGGFSQPSLALRLDGHPFATRAVTLAVDVRARRTYTNLSDGSALTDGRNRAYQAALSVGAPESPTRLTVGRQISGNLASVGMFDGLLAEMNHKHWSTGVFTGAQPDPVQLDFSTQIVEAGAYLQGHSGPSATSHWSLTLGTSGSYDGGQANREFAYVQGSVLTPRLWTFFTQEIDYYRPWKRLTSLDAVSPTNTFALLRYRVTRGVTLDAGFDNRRNVVLYRDVVNPATVFDDTYRQGAWAGCSIRFSGRYLVGVDARSSSGGPAGRADAYTMSVSAGPITRVALTLRSRTTWYSSAQLTGWLQTVAFGIAPGGRLHLELNGGGRQEWNPVLDPPTNVWVTWLGADLDLNLARSWYLVVSANRETGGFDGSDQIYGGMSYRF
jgi:hypothetical protein